MASKRRNMFGMNRGQGAAKRGMSGEDEEWNSSGSAECEKKPEPPEDEEMPAAPEVDKEAGDGSPPGVGGGTEAEGERPESGGGGARGRPLEADSPLATDSPPAPVLRVNSLLATDPARTPALPAPSQQEIDYIASLPPALQSAHARSVHPKVPEGGSVCVSGDVCSTWLSRPEECVQMFLPWKRRVQ
ncbi:hypothetical protein AAG570_001226 [Ranatra chinensis]|uniref:Uncharacterized protein n=1 Tax=Ranatra chinensis TaxID=642074 RepID=A0ABD0YMZ1_9HEMI